MSSCDFVYAIKTQGYAWIRGGLDADRVKAIAALIDRLIEEDDEKWGEECLTKMKQRGAIRNLINEDRVFEDLFTDSPVYPAIDSVMMSEYVLNSFIALVLFPGMERFPWDFHTDILPFVGTAFPAGSCAGINCLYYLDEVNEVNGATRIVPSSHRCVMQDPSVEALQRLAIPAEGGAGDILLFDARLWHCAGNNNTSRRRALIKALYCPAWLRPEMDYTRSVSSKVIERLGTRGRRLLGVGSRPPASVEELRLGLPQS